MCAWQHVSPVWFCASAGSSVLFIARFISGTHFGRLVEFNVMSHHVIQEKLYQKDHSPVEVRAIIMGYADTLQREQLVAQENKVPYRRTARCGVVWCGVVWCGVMWCGVVSVCAPTDLMRPGL